MFRGRRLLTPTTFVRAILNCGIVCRRLDTRTSTMACNIYLIMIFSNLDRSGVVAASCEACSSSAIAHSTSAFAYRSLSFFVWGLGYTAFLLCGLVIASTSLYGSLTSSISTRSKFRTSKKMGAKTRWKRNFQAQDKILFPERMGCQSEWVEEKQENSKVPPQGGNAAQD